MVGRDDDNGRIVAESALQIADKNAEERDDAAVGHAAGPAQRPLVVARCLARQQRRR